VTPWLDDGDVRLYHGDCLEVLPTLEPASVTLLFTDPPYGHGNHVDDLNARLNDHRGIEGKPIANDGADDMRRVVDAMLTLALPLLRDDCCCCCCCCCCGGGGPSPTFAWVADRLDRDGYQFFHSVIWDKVNPGLGWRYRRQHEMVMVAHKRDGKLAWRDDKQAIPNVISAFPGRERLHPNEKPAGLVAKFIDAHTSPGDLVLDPFAGSGTTLAVARSMGRRAIGIELEREWCEVAAARLGQMSLLGDAA
jgi:site-specific DNA-methyltransferase (adenine-specific)